MSITSTVTGQCQTNAQFQLTPQAGVLAGQQLPLGINLAAAFRKSGVAQDQCDSIHIKRYTFAASTPQTIDLQSLANILADGATVSLAKVRLIAIKVHWTTDAANLLVGGAGANEWDGFLSSGGKLTVAPSSPGVAAGSTANDGYFALAAPNLAGIPVTSTSHLLKLDPGTQAGDVTILIAGTSS